MFSRWISVLLIVMIAVAIYFSLRPKAWEKTADDGEGAEEAVEADQPSGKAF